MEHFAHAIIGGGVAGSRLATHLAAGHRGPLVVVEPHVEDPRTLAVFEDPSARWTDPFVVHRWPHLRVRGSGREVRMTPSRSYVIVRAQDLRDRAIEALEAAGGEVVRGHAVSVIHEGDRAIVELDDGTTLSADWVYDSRIDERDNATALRQTFAGVWVETDVDTFDPDVVTLMDFDAFAGARAGHRLRFAHAMPTSPRRALVTAVVVGPGRPALPVGPWLGSIVDTSVLRISAHESGSTPLMLRPPVRWAGPRWLRVGVAGGMLKASTGYAVQRIEADVRAIAAAIAETGRPAFPPHRHAVPWRWLDRVLLTLVMQQGQASAEVFLALFERCPADAIVAFLEEDATCSSVASTVLRLPRWEWFARAGFTDVIRPL